MRHFMRLAYNGAPYSGWQVQPGRTTVQGCLEQALQTIMRRPVPVTGAGRTDAGVNASMMIAHFDTPGPIDDPAGTIYRLNSMLGRDIAVYDIIPVHDTAHARFDATERTYWYHAVTVKDPFRYPLSWKAPANLDFEAMNRAAAMLLDTDDFTSFSKLHTDTRTNLCNVTAARWHEAGQGEWIFEITANRFLRNMVRAVVGTLVEVGRGKMTIGQFGDVIARRDRCAAGTSMPGQALFLHHITYPYLELPQGIM